MKHIANQLLAHCRRVPRSLRQLSETDWAHRPAPGKWSKKEIIGHLIDSAANNHQRFVRAQRDERPIVSYAQDDWVRIEDFQAADARQLLRLWEAYNRHLAHVISKIPPENLAKPLVMGGKEVTLQWCVEDYLRHLEHHLAGMRDEG
ncbi:MAG: DinB family protein [Saprospiraceae bacterium]